MADPFPLDGDHFVAEEYPFFAGVGRLAYFETSTGRRIGEFPLEPDPGVHLSYPLVVTEGDARYVLPEQSAADRLDLYRITQTGAELESTLIDGVDVADATPVQVGDRWYLFFTLGTVDPLGEQLHIHHAGDLRGDWQPHPCSPVSGGGPRWRPAGPFFRVDGELYRPSQDSSAGYGSATIINRVVTLDATTYDEEPLCEVRSIESSHDEGCHTLTAIDDERTLVDAKRRAIRLDFHAGRAWRRATEGRR